ncbi:SMEK domain-containing protein [Bacillus cereus group sp. MYBK57-1]|uniref:SMEK domain-containing protein n=1 Tax=Bacillus cereus group sp. MYBK57-1 TaxID=3450619 RepID=UPI003F7ADA00
MLKRKDQIEDIIKSLSLLQYYIKFSSNKLGLHDINKTCEAFFCELFNILWGTNYKVLEYEQINHPAIDLGDKTNKHSMQITSDGSKTKLWKTIDKFEEYELYKEYSVLFHFVIGEKHYSPRKSDEIKFKKSKSNNTYSIDKEIKNTSYKIIIIDLMDLLILINKKKNKDVSKIHEYIKENINLPIETLKNKGYKIDPDELKVFTAKSFIKYCGVDDPTEQETFLLDIQKFANKINDMDKNSREFIYGVLYNHSMNSTDSEDIIVSPNAIQRYLRMNEVQLISEVEVLENAGIFDKDAAEDEGKLRICFYDSEGIELIGTIYKYCLDKKISLKDLILKPDFSLLD